MEFNTFQSEKLHELITAGICDVDQITGFKKDGADINYIKPSCGHPILFMSICTKYNNGMHIAQTLIKLGANINIQNTRGTTLLMDIVKTNNLPYVEYLLENGADVTICDKSGFDALFYATMNFNYHNKHYANDIVGRVDNSLSSDEINANNNLDDALRQQRNERINTAKAIVDLIKESRK